MFIYCITCRVYVQKQYQRVMTMKATPVAITLITRTLFATMKKKVERGENLSVVLL